MQGRDCGGVAVASSPRSDGATGGYPMRRALSMDSEGAVSTANSTGGGLQGGGMNSTGNALGGGEVNELIQ